MTNETCACGFTATTIPTEDEATLCCCGASCGCDQCTCRDCACGEHCTCATCPCES